MTVLMSCRDIEKTYVRGREKVKVLDGVSLDVEEGEFLALMGPSGSGKTTLLNLMGGLDNPTRGEVSMLGQSLGKLSSDALARWRSHNVGFVFQFYNLLPVLNALHNVELPLLLTPLSRAERKRKALIALQIVDLAARARHKPNELSGGQQQRVAIARAIVGGPKLLVCDEPTGDLDRASADSILDLLQMLNEDYGKTIIMVTHDPKAAGHARRLLHLDKGKLVQEVSK